IKSSSGYVLRFQNLCNTKPHIRHSPFTVLLFIAIPKMICAADLWFSPVYQEGTANLQRGSIGVAKHLSTVQCTVTLTITGAMQSTATDILKVHSNLLPIMLLLQNTCY
ncbi:hypothetical protein DEU56DRAFT_744003, partial [Suillus clintonianus]|uniref:uncharacterized protein n=1 Tax=Suillus clintonianus TaxID=1904413 RepID=UPI001B885335